MLHDLPGRIVSARQLVGRRDCEAGAACYCFGAADVKGQANDLDAVSVDTIQRSPATLGVSSSLLPLGGRLAAL